MMSKFLVYFLFFLLFSKYSRCDLPVHCKMEEIFSLWTFRINSVSFNPSLVDDQTTCGHGFPDQIDNTIGDINYKFDRFTEIEMILSNDYKVYDKTGVLQQGNWTMIYDEGFVVYYQNMVFTAFMKYYKNSMKDKDYSSNCDKTMIGWVIEDGRENTQNWHCFFGFKSAIKNQFSNKFLENDESYSAKKEQSNSAFLEMELGAISETNMKMIDYLQEEIVQEINNNSELLWKADIYDDYKNLTFFDLRKKLGLFNKTKKMSTINSLPSEFNKLMMESSPINQPNSLDSFLERNIEAVQSPPVERDRDGNLETNYEVISKYLLTELPDIDENTLPKNWDWRNIGGVNYVPKPEIQGECGSCYIFSMISSLESRLRILTNNQDQTKFSRQFPLACSFYTEGCQGGYPYLVAKFMNEFEIIPENCMPYNPKIPNCKNICDYTLNKYKYRVSKFEYLGGFYGGTSEVDIMKEIRARGPIPGNMRVPWTFSYYRKGIFSEKTLIKNSGKLNKIRMLDKKLTWSNVEHSILLVGYGEENGVKYWIGMNTWGENWGEKGFFRILRGENECNIETMGDCARIEKVPRM